MDCAETKNRNGGKTGWPPGMLQDDDRKLSRWLASRIDSRRHAREAAASIRREVSENKAIDGRCDK